MFLSVFVNKKSTVAMATTTTNIYRYDLTCIATNEGDAEKQMSMLDPLKGKKNYLYNSVALNM